MVAEHYFIAFFLAYFVPVVDLGALRNLLLALLTFVLDFRCVLVGHVYRPQFLVQAIQQHRRQELRAVLVNVLRVKLDEFVSKDDLRIYDACLVVFVDLGRRVLRCLTEHVGIKKACQLSELV